MEAVTGEQPNHFPQQITPFPESLDLTSALDAAKYEPPQKLRPIRRSAAEDPSSFLAEQLGAGLGESIALFEVEKAGLASVEESLDPKTEWCSWEDDSRYVLKVFFFFFFFRYCFVFNSESFLLYWVYFNV